MSRQQLRRSDEEQRERECDQPPRRAADPAERLLQLQRSAGNQAVQRILQRAFDPTYRFDGGKIEITKIETQDQLDVAVETLIEEELGGVRALFTKRENGGSPSAWAEFVLGYMEDGFELDPSLGEPQVRIAINKLKDKHRLDTLLHIANVFVYWVPFDDKNPTASGPPYSLENLKTRMALGDDGAFLEPADDAALQAIFDTEGKFAKLKIDVADDCIELLDEDNIVVVMDSHQQKHQRTQIPKFGTYIGKPGTKFAEGKDLDWHKANTARTVHTSVATSVQQGLIVPGQTYAPSKDAIDGINYDLGITLDQDTGKYVGSYHCNPVKDE